MEILDKLKNIFESHFKDVFANNTFKLLDFSKNINVFLKPDDDQKEKLLINLEKADDDQKEKVKKILDESREDGEEGFLTEKVVKKTDQIKRSLPKQDDENLLNFYIDKLGPGVYTALELSLIVRSSFKKGEDISELKQDISNKFPSFGNNICNLVSSNYFEGYFKELYDIMSEEEDFDIDKYKAEVKRIAIELPYMVFINKYKSFEEFAGEIEFKLNKLKRYGTNKLKLHAIGRDNVEKAIRLAERYRKYSEINIKIEINLNKTIVTIIFKF